MSELRIFRTLGIPLAIALIFLLFLPKLCQRAIVQVKQNKQAPSGLVISGAAPAGASSGPLNFPPGLDAGRIQYLVEIDQTFSAPHRMLALDASTIAKPLLDRHWIEKRPDGTFGPTSAGSINVNGAMDSPRGWIVPVAQRKVLGVQSIDDAGDGRYSASVRWRWEPNTIGADLLKKPQDHHLVAEFAGGEHHWVLMRFVKEPDQEWR
jgi:hypothetical protein